MITQTEILVPTAGRGTYDITREVQSAVADTAVSVGLCNVFIRHTSASLMLCENADPAVMRDLEAFMARTVPDGDPLYTHVAEGPDDMAAHVRSVLTHADINLPIRDGRCDLGTWQGVFLWEHRTGPHQRKVTVTVNGE
ncbi:MAG TPA: secondary thiamine-phosphate synthase enzyme YjbQ [Woeseiaceae bacterium]|nr:secondary thiamine-phosphate synthase enzyme YjbQ [Woeseiaceae bacterium]